MTSLDLCRPATARAVARRFGIAPAKGLGQHFLIDRQVRDAIAATAAGAGRVLEIGPGLGALTQGLLELGIPVTAVELDPRCVAALGLLRRTDSGLRVVEGDVLRLDPPALGMERPLVVGNLPYRITGPILSRVLSWRPAVPACRVLVQREVGRRLAAAAGDWSLATLMVRLAAEVDIEFDVGPASFWPPPRVHSSLITLRPSPGFAPEEAERLARLARPIFQARRKQLHHGLARSLGVEPRAAAQLLLTAGLDPTRRPGTLGLEEWRRLLLAVGGGAAPIG